MATKKKVHAKNKKTASCKPQFLTHAQYRGKALYDLVSAVRGYDCGCSTRALVGSRLVKEQITGRIRVIVFGDTMIKLGIWKLSPMRLCDFLETAEGLKALATNASVDSHWLSHLEDALVASKTHPIWGKFGEPLFALCSIAASYASNSRLGSLAQFDDLVRRIKALPHN